MNSNPRILSTKVLEPSQKELLLNAGLPLVEYDFIKIVPVDFETDEFVENAIFTSQNAVNSISNRNITITNVFCVGDKTEARLEALGYTITEKGYQAKALAQKIVKNHPNKEFTFFCTEKRREELPALLKKHQIPLKEIEVYKTIQQSKEYTGVFDAVLFFSPSAVESFAKRNLFENTTAFCIGKTTETALKKYTNNIITANRTTIENVIVQVIKHYS